ncbi:hypothetical protein [Flavobacterium subsaxonicum]|uniref:Uncharacterized protein n=1 Tax=Flavobacterium subsaxonicum WB 4.1-42 = DSM 21790 TaxID=1121898 RepID=A0A0A2MR93_9FLAO|nr:hypothetical protein [Flavobacterium subsaxonicum]KGO94869.1 hypothetical protein Q766_01770 [Flavobacterium subsaxonicum WB 4.1-42 = DSM 21790]
MKKILLCTALFAVSISGYSQTEATTKEGKKVLLNSNGTWAYADGDCNTLTETKTYAGGKVMSSAKEVISVSSDAGKTGITINIVKGTGALILNLGRIEREIFCVSKNAPMSIEFTDGTKLAVKHMGDLNCNGNFSCFLGEQVGTDKELEILKTKKIKKVSIEYTDTENGNVKKFTKEYTLSADQTEKINKIIKCLTNS